jgi:hypothetical protein
LCCAVSNHDEEIHWRITLDVNGVNGGRQHRWRRLLRRASDRFCELV